MKLDTSEIANISHSKSSPKIAIFILMLAAFSLLTTEFIIVGLLPALARDLNISISAAGQLVTIFAFAVMICGPFLTAWLSHIERKKLFIGILIIFAISNALSALSTTYGLLAFSRLLAALALPVFWGTASETAGQLVSPEQSSKAISQVYLGVTGALVFGIPIGTLVSDVIGWRGSFWLIAILCLIIAVLLYIYMPISKPNISRAANAKQTDILKDWSFIIHVLLSIFVFTSMFTAYTYLADLLERLALIPQSQVGWWLMLFGAIGMIGNYWGAHLLRKGALRATSLLLILLIIGMLLTSFLASNKALLIVPLAIWGIAYTALFPVCQVRVMEAGSKAQAFAGTINVSAANGGIGLGAVIGGAVLQYSGLTFLSLVASIIALVAIFIATVLSKKKTM